jgi:hypothetical protein
MLSRLARRDPRNLPEKKGSGEPQESSVLDSLDWKSVREMIFPESWGVHHSSEISGAADQPQRGIRAGSV